MLCRECSIVNETFDTLRANPLLCRSWSCDYCRPARKRTVCREAAAGNPVIFVTLTVNPRWGDGPDHRAQELVRGWREFVKAAKHYHGYDSIPYYVVFEATKKGEPHLHILCRVPWIDQKLLSTFMDFWMKAPIVYIVRCTSNRNAARYVSKYIGKEPGKFGTCKRYWQTQNYQLPDEDEQLGSLLRRPPPDIRRQSVDDWIIWARRVGYPVVIHNESCTITKRVPP
jgi:hypothetical protein